MTSKHRIYEIGNFMFYHNIINIVFMKIGNFMIRQNVIIYDIHKIVSLPISSSPIFDGLQHFIIQ